MRDVHARQRRLALAFVFAAMSALAPTARAQAARVNPLVIQRSNGEAVTSCADPTVIKGQQQNDDYWYMYCTADPLNNQDKDGGGNWNYHLIPVFRSLDLVHWAYVGDALSSRPAWAEMSSNIWAPEIQYFRNKYYLYYAVTDTRPSISGQSGCADDSAVGVATSSSPTGPFTNSATPVVYPRRSGTGCSFYLTIDPEVIIDAGGQKWIYYGNFNGGIEVRQLANDGLSSNAATAVQVVRPDIGEAPLVIQHGGLYYLLFSSSSCCSGPLSGYIVFAGRSTSPTGPFTDKYGASLTAARAGGTPVLAATGNRWIGPGHNTAVTDFAGQDWTIYHAIDEADPYFAGSVGFTRRPAMLEPLDWVDGWPTARGGWWVSHCRQPAPVGQPGGTPEYGATFRRDDAPGVLIAEASDEFDGPLGAQWSWIRPPGAGAWGLEGGALRFDTQNGDLYGDQNNVSVLVEPAPAGDIVVEARVRHTVPNDGSIHNYTQAGLVVYGDDDNYIKLAAVANWGSRQTEFGKELSPVPPGYPFYGGSRVGPPGDWTWLRIVRRGVFGGELYTAYTSVDGVTWTRGATWRHALGAAAKIGLVSMSGAGFSAYFDYVRTWTLAAPDCADAAFADPCDDDGDGTGDLCDPDDDNDLLPDIEDCAPDDAFQGNPAEIASLTVSGAPATTVNWSPAPRADFYDVLRGGLGGWAAGDYGACLANDRAELSVDDSETPAAGGGFTYLVRGVDSGCGGPGSYGFSSSGAERNDLNPQACP